MQSVAKRTVLQLLCDWCGLVKEDVEKRTIFLPGRGGNGRQVTFDACEDCRSSVTLAQWETLLPKKPKTTRRNRVVSVEEVEALAKKRPRKRVG